MSKSDELMPHNGQWDGKNGMRYTGVGVVSGGNFHGAEGWIKDRGLLPKLDDETWVEWDARTNGGLGSTALNHSVEVSVEHEGEVDGTD